MKKLAIGLAAAVFSSMFLFPAIGAHAYDYDSPDSYAIHHQRHKLHHDYWELRNDVRHGDHAAAAHEQREMNRRRARIERMRRDRDWDSRYGYGPYSYGYGHRHWDEY